MNREEAKQWTALFQAIADGESLQRYSHRNNRWEDLSSGERPNVYTYFPHEYRIKPEPVEVYVWHNPDPPRGLKTTIAVHTEDPLGDDAHFWCERGYTKIKMREVQD